MRRRRNSFKGQEKSKEIYLKTETYAALFLLNSEGVHPVNFLKAVLKEDLELNPHSIAIARMEK